MRDKYKFLGKNIFYLLISSFSTKLLSFFLVPLYTNVLSTEEYGSYDFLATTVSLLIPILTVEIAAAVFIFAIDENYNRKEVLSVAIRYLIGSSAIVFLFLVVNEIFQFIPIVSQYREFFLLMYIVNASSGIFMEFTRAMGNMLNMSIASALCSFCIIICNILFLLVFEWGLEGYFLANIVGGLVQIFFLIIKGNLLSGISIRINYATVQKEMTKYSAPLISNSVAWWINSASDRYVVVGFCGLAENGVYSVASKIPSILNIVQTVFNQAWGVSVIKEFDPDDKEGFFTRTYNVYNLLLITVCSCIIAGNRILANLLYAKDFYPAWKYVPFLTMAIIFGSLSGFIGGFFSAMKKSSILAKSTMVGAIINFILNLIMVPFIGALGAAIATVISYWLVWMFRTIHVRKNVNIKFRLVRDHIGYLLLVVQTAVTLIVQKDSLMLWIFHLCILVLLFLLNKSEVIEMWEFVRKKIFKNK